MEYREVNNFFLRNDREKKAIRETGEDMAAG